MRNMSNNQRSSRRTLIALAFSAAASSAIAGPDIIVGEISGVWKWGTVGDTTGYTIGTTSCNIGDANAQWFPIEAEHPVIAQNLYRLRPIGGVMRFEQIGMSWLKHAGSTVAGNLCGTCNGDQGYVLGVGCSDPYSAQLNGDQVRMGPRSEVNPWTGVYPYPYNLGWNQSGDALYKRMRIPNAELNPTVFSDSLFFTEAQYICTDEPEAARYNNVSHRRTTVGPLVGGGWTLSQSTQAGLTQVERPAIYAWRDHGLGLGTPDPEVLISAVDVPGDGRIYVASRCYYLGGSFWRYEYAVYNMNADRAVRLVSIPIPNAITFWDVGMSYPSHHSGEPFSSTTWQFSGDNQAGTWWAPTFAQDPNANAIRWGTMYSFWLMVDRAPSVAPATLGLFKPGETSSVTVPVYAVSAIPPICPVDANGDGRTNGADLSVLLFQFGQTVERPGAGADFNVDGVVNAADLSVLLSNFGCGG